MNSLTNHEMCGDDILILEKAVQGWTIFSRAILLTKASLTISFLVREVYSTNSHQKPDPACPSER